MSPRRQFVLDTNVVSALRVKGRNPQVEAWASSVAVTDQFVTAVTMAEIERGVVTKERADPPQGEVLRRWFDSRVLPAFSGRVLAFDLEAARILATYRVPEHAPLDDALTAAIAQSADMVIVTRNTRHFEPLGVVCLDPWRSAPTSPRPVADHAWQSGAMDEQQVREQLAAKEAELAEQMARLTRPEQDQGAISFGKRVGDGTAMAVDRLTAVGAHDNLQEILDQVHRAQAKLDEGSYGRCDECGEPIAEGRLEVRSWSTHCLRHG